jgi:predicted MFS family arabinose efflux permease
MNPEEKELLRHVLKLSEENNHILRKIQRSARWALLWGFIKIAIIVVPLVAGYIYLQPFLEQALENYGNIQGLLNT